MDQDIPQARPQAPWGLLLVVFLPTFLADIETGKALHDWAIVPRLGVMAVISLTTALVMIGLVKAFQWLVRKKGG